MDDLKEQPIIAAELPPESLKKRSKQSRFAHEIAYGLRQTLTCWATDFLDPPISSWYQKHWGKKGQGGEIDQTVKGEIVGDSAAFFVYVALKRIFTGPIDMIISSVKAVGNPILDRMGKRAVKSWADAHEISEDDPRYKQRLDDYKSFQAENAVDSSIISVSATALNVVAQRKLFGNRQTYGTILKSKLLGAGLTMGVMGSLSVFFPNATKAFDNELEDRYISKVIRFTKKGLGLKDEKAPIITKTPEGQSPESATPLSPEKREGLLIMVADHAKHIDWNNPEQRAALLAKQKSVYQAFIKVFDPEGPLLQVMAREHYEVIEKERKQQFDREPDDVLRDLEASRNSVQASAAHKRRDMQQFIALLSDDKFLAEVKAVIESGKLPERRNTSITLEQKQYMSESLLQNSLGDVQSAAEEQALDYRALAHALEPKALAGRTLASELKKHLPNYDPKDIDGIAKDYMGYYQQEALSMANMLSNDSPIVKQAVERSLALQSKYASEKSFAQAL